MLEPRPGMGVTHVTHDARVVAASAYYMASYFVSNVRGDAAFTDAARHAGAFYESNAPHAQGD